MSEEVKAPEVKTPTTDEIGGDVIRNHPLFRAATSEIPKLRSELEAMRNAESERRRLIAEEKAKASGDLEAFKAQEKARYDSEITAARAEAKRAKIEALTAGILDEDRREGVIAKMEKLAADVDMTAWIYEYKTSKPHLWQQELFPVQGSQQQGGRPSTKTATLTRVQLEEMKKSTDPKIRAEAYDHMDRLWKTTGKTMPD